MKRIICLILVLVMFAGLAMPAAAVLKTEYVFVNYRAIKLFVNGEEIVPCDGAGTTVEPFIMSSTGTTYLPLRAVAQALGLNVHWDGDANTVSLKDGGTVKTGAGPAGSTRALRQMGITYRNIRIFLNGEELSLVNANGDTVEPFILNSNSSVYLPLRIIGEALGLNVHWDGVANTVSLKQAKSYTVSFVDYDGKLLDTQTVAEGRAAAAPADPSREGYIFMGWDCSFNKIVSDLTVTACYEKYNPDEEYEGELSFSLSSDGKSYIVSGCPDTAEEVSIPAVYKGLPVSGIEPGAFMDCQYLSAISVSAANRYIYSEDGVVFTDSPVKTLVCFPPFYNRVNYYYVPEDVKAIGPYAFAGLSWLTSLTIPEGVTTMGDCAFAEVKTQTLVFVPRSLTVIGKNILKSQQSNMPFYGPDWECAMAVYCLNNNLTYGTVVETGPKQTTIKTSVPAHRTDNLIPVGDNYIVFDGYLSKDEPNFYEYMYIYRLYDLSSFEEKTEGEVRLPLDEVWKLIQPEDPQIKDFPTQSGLYGAGYTEGEAVLRAYDKNGELIAMQDIGGNFSFSFPDARSIGVEGGSGTKLTVYPVEPVFVQSSGSYAVEAEKCYKLPNGNVFQILIVQYPYASVYRDFPQHLNFVGGIFRSCTDSYVYENSPNYMIMQLETQDASRLEALKAYAFVFDGLQSLVDNDEISVTVAKNFNTPANFGQKCYDLLKSLKTTMVGKYFPAGLDVNKITIIADGSYPSAYESKIILDKYGVENFDKKTIIHEMVHAVDQSISSFEMTPSSWMEGRAEYISFKVCDQLAISYWNGHTDFDWSYLTAEEKADFFHYFYFNPDRNTPYSVGYHFMCYIVNKYGEDAPARIMANVAEVEYDWSMEKDVAAAHFKKCVEDATEVGVFQNFVRDVIGG